MLEDESEATAIQTRFDGPDFARIEDWRRSQRGFRRGGDRPHAGQARTGCRSPNEGTHPMKPKAPGERGLVRKSNCLNAQ